MKQRERTGDTCVTRTPTHSFRCTQIFLGLAAWQGLASGSSEKPSGNQRSRRSEKGRREKLSQADMKNEILWSGNISVEKYLVNIAIWRRWLMINTVKFSIGVAASWNLSELSSHDEYKLLWLSCDLIGTDVPRLTV